MVMERLTLMSSLESCAHRPWLLSSSPQVFKGKEGAAAAFKQIDVNGDGLLSKQEMSSAILGGSRLSKSEVDAIFKLGDVNGDGEIDMEEFLAVMCPSIGFSMSTSSSSSASFSKTTVTSTSI